MNVLQERGGAGIYRAGEDREAAGAGKGGGQRIVVRDSGRRFCLKFKEN